MTSTNLQRYDGENGIELFIDRKDGSAYASIRGYARMSGLSQPAISKRAAKGDNQTLIKTAEVQTQRGVQGVNLIPESLIADWIISDNPTLAKQMLSAGCRVYLYGVAGYEVKPQPTTPQTYIEALRALADAEEAKERQRQELERQQIELQLADDDIQQLSTTVDEVFGYSSIIRVAKFNGVSEKRFKWQTLKSQTIALGKEVKRVPCPRFEYRNLYPHEAWEVAYPDVALPEQCHWGLEGRNDRPQLPEG